MIEEWSSEKKTLEKSDDDTIKFLMVLLLAVAHGARSLMLLSLLCNSNRGDSRPRTQDPRLVEY